MMMRRRRARSAVAIAAGAAVLATVPLFIHHAPAPRDVRARVVRAAAAWSAAAPPQPAPSAGGKTPRDGPDPEAEAAAWFQAEVARIVSEVDPDLHAHLHGLITRGAKPFNAAQQKLFSAVKAAGALLGQDITWKPSGGVCEGNNLFASGLPNVDTLGVRGGDIHSEAEHAWPESFVERAQLSATILMKLASGEIDARAIRAAMENA